MSAYRDPDRRLALALGLVNTFDPYYAEPEALRTPADLQRFLTQFGIVPTAALGPGDLAAARQLRSRLTEVVQTDEPRVALAALNGLLADARVVSRLSLGDGGTWRLETVAEPDAPPLRRLAVDAAIGLAEALERNGLERLRQCAASPCQEAFLDTTRNGSRRFCSDRCANRHNVAAFRRRRTQPGA
jgi:predicted RNA-binding Zn ribbon-like protein